MKEGESKRRSRSSLLPSSPFPTSSFFASTPPPPEKKKNHKLFKSNPGIVLTNDGNAILREIDVSHPAAKVRQREEKERKKASPSSRFLLVLVPSLSLSPSFPLLLKSSPIIS